MGHGPRLAALSVALAWTCMVWALTVGADESPKSVARDEAGDRSAERIVVREDGSGSERTLEGRVVVEAVDGGLLFERFDSSLQVLEPGTILARHPVSGEPFEESPEAMGRRILAELPEGFELLVTRHYCVCHDTSRAYAQWCAAVFERLYDAFTNFWHKAGFDVRPPTRPLAVVIFSDQARYMAHAAAALGPAADRVAGYYDLMSNRITTYDLTGSDAVRQARDGDRATARLGILSSPAASGLVATLVHEATHQMAYNCGMHRRLAPVPLWVSEGIAMYFETPDLDSSRGWRGIGLVNQPRMQQWRSSPRTGGLESIVADDAAFRDEKEGLDSYARAWALAYFLLQTRRTEFVAYLRLLAEKRPFEEDSAKRRLEDFKRAFGDGPSGMEPGLVRFMDRLRSK